jgi:hypothetical protein
MQSSIAQQFGARRSTILSVPPQLVFKVHSAFTCLDPWVGWDRFDTSRIALGSQDSHCQC